jgi:hypothetical protein
MNFTQFLRPDGRQVPVTIDRPAPIEAQAAKLIAAGYRLECEHLQTGDVSFTVTSKDCDEVIEVVANGPQVPAAVDRLVTKAAERLL